MVKVYEEVWAPQHGEPKVTVRITRDGDTVTVEPVSITQAQADAFCDDDMKKRGGAVYRFKDDPVGWFEALPDNYLNSSRTVLREVK